MWKGLLHMKKILSLFLALCLLFLTACNTIPPMGSDGSSTSSSNTDNRQEDLTEQIIVSKKSNLLDLPSRIVFEGDGFTYYFSKADGKAYIYCFDPLCDHSDYTCLGNPKTPGSLWNISNVIFTNNRFYSVTGLGQITSYSFDGSDKRIEYDAKYDLTNVHTNLWECAGLYGHFIYILSTADGMDTPHLLRFNIETKEMEDLTEKTGNYIEPRYFYQGKIYGKGNYFESGEQRFVSDIDLKSIEIDENPLNIFHVIGDIAFEYIYEYWTDNAIGLVMSKVIGINVFNFKTDERWTIPGEAFQVDKFTIAAITENYLYFYESGVVTIGTIITNTDGKEVERKVQKMNDGKIYRMNLDGTNIVCVYDNPDYEINRNAVFYEDRVVMQGQYVAIENGKKKVWGGPLQVAVINEDGTFGEFREVEVVG